MPLNPEEAATLLRTHAAQLAEHFASVVIIATIEPEPGQWSMTSFGMGNYFAQKASAQDWLTKQQIRLSQYLASHPEHEG